MGYCLPTVISDRGRTHCTAVTFINTLFAAAGTITAAVTLKFMKFMKGHNTFHYWSLSIACKEPLQLIYTNLS
jgi:hypothetical protein